MRIFLYEYTCAAAAELSVAAVLLRAEGAAMLRAIREDFQRIPGVEVICPSPPDLLPNGESKSNGEASFRAAARRADYSLIIAPEFDGILHWCCRWVLEEGGRLLGPSPDAVALTSDKLEMYRRWQAHGVPTPETQLFEPEAQAKSFAFASDTVILKQRDGAGCSFARTVFQADWPRFQEELSANSQRPSLIVQPFIPGQAASVSFLIGPRHCLALPSAAQHLESGEYVKYVGGEIPLPEPLAIRAERIARRAIAGIPGLLGYVGVDVVLGDDGRDWAIEINPRLTTSYIGLRALAEFNLAEALLAVVHGNEPPKWKWRTGRVRFRTDGSCAQVS